MIEVFTTSIQNQKQADSMLRILKNSFPELKFNFDLSDTGANFPCEHSILRVEGTKLDSDAIISAVSQSAFKCEVLEDKICT